MVDSTNAVKIIAGDAQNDSNAVGGAFHQDAFQLVFASTRTNGTWNFFSDCFLQRNVVVFFSHMTTSARRIWSQLTVLLDVKPLILALA